MFTRPAADAVSAHECPPPVNRVYRSLLFIQEEIAEYPAETSAIHGEDTDDDAVFAGFDNAFGQIFCPDVVETRPP